MVTVSSYSSLPSKPGIYFFLDKFGDVLYVGKAKDLKKRVSSYFINSTKLLPKTKILVSKIEKIKIVFAESEIEALLLEANYIKKYKPKYNTKLTDGKAYPLIRITTKDKFPKVLVARKSDTKESLYFGPFPNSSAVKLVLRTIRKIFPFQSVVNHPKKPCLYYHLDLCPCPELFDAKVPPLQRWNLINEYRENIKHIIDFLGGKTKKVIKDLKTERDCYSKFEEFEKANFLQKKIDAILYVTSPVYQKFDYRINPNLETDLRKEELSELKKRLVEHNMHVNKLIRIECFDISNISGTNATGSMIVFINGESDSSQYRRFKVKNLHNLPNLPNDYAMMQQVVSRRLNHKEWHMPDLIIVDGGKGQVSSAKRGLRKQGMTIPVIGLAKREEVIITSDYQQIVLPKDSEALKLVMKIRDEAHRFAISYHRKLRSKAQIPI